MGANDAGPCPQAYFSARAASAEPCAGSVKFDPEEHSKMNTTELKGLNVIHDCAFDPELAGGLNYTELSAKGFVSISKTAMSLFVARENLRSVSPLSKQACKEETKRRENVALLEKKGDSTLCVGGICGKLCFDAPGGSTGGSDMTMGEGQEVNEKSAWKGVPCV